MAVIYETIEQRVCDEEDCDRIYARPCSNCDMDFCGDHEVQISLDSFFDDQTMNLQTTIHICRKCFYIEKTFDLLKLFEKEIGRNDWRVPDWKKAVWRNDPFVKLTGVEPKEEK